MSARRASPEPRHGERLACQDEDAGADVPERRPTGEAGRLARGALAAAREAVIGEDDDGGVRPRRRHQPADDVVLQEGERFDHRSEAGRLVVGDARHGGRLETREVVPDRIEPLEVDHGQIGARPRQDLEGGGLDTARRGDDRLQALHRLLEIGAIPGEQTAQIVRPQPVRLDAQRVDRRGALRREDARLGRHRRAQRRQRVRPAIGDHDAPNLLRRPGGPPADHRGAEPRIGDLVPHRLDAPPAPGHRHRTPAVRIVLDEIENAVRVRGPCRGDGGPQERGQGRPLRRQRPARAPRHQGREVREAALAQHRLEAVPVRPVHADDQQAHAARPPGKRGRRAARHTEAEEQQQGGRRGATSRGGAPHA